MQIYTIKLKKAEHIQNSTLLYLNYTFLQFSIKQNKRKNKKTVVLINYPVLIYHIFIIFVILYQVVIIGLYRLDVTWVA